MIAGFVDCLELFFMWFALVPLGGRWVVMYSEYEEVFNFWESISPYFGIRSPWDMRAMVCFYHPDYAVRTPYKTTTSFFLAHYFHY
jgi:hypothetical protein